MLIKKLIITILNINGKIIGHPIVSKNRYSAWFNYLILYIKAKILGLRSIYCWINKLKIIIDIEDWYFARNVYLKINEFNESCFTVHFLKEKDIFVDIGANVGHYTLLASGISGCRTIAIEPIPLTFKKLKQNISLNNLNSKTTLYNIGLGSTEGKLFFNVVENNALSHVSSENYSDGIEIPSTTLSSLLVKIKPKMLKIDVEGYEYEVLKGANNLLREPSLEVLIIEINEHGTRYGVSEEVTMRYIESFGFKPFAYLPFKRTLKAITIPNRKSENIIYLKNENAVRMQLLKGQKIIINSRLWI